MVDPPHRVVYTWRLDDAAEAERVSVSFEARGAETLVTVRHERIPDSRARDGHEAGWKGCLEGLDTYVR